MAQRRTPTGGRLAFSEMCRPDQKIVNLIQLKLL
jgi:hypothetical protein